MGRRRSEGQGGGEGVREGVREKVREGVRGGERVTCHRHGRCIWRNHFNISHQEHMSLVFIINNKALGLVFVTPLAIIWAMHNYGKLEISFAIPNFNK